MASDTNKSNIPREPDLGPRETPVMTNGEMAGRLSQHLAPELGRSEQHELAATIEQTVLKDASEEERANIRYWIVQLETKAQMFAFNGRMPQTNREVMRRGGKEMKEFFAIRDTVLQFVIDKLASSHEELPDDAFIAIRLKNAPTRTEEFEELRRTIEGYAEESSKLHTYKTPSLPSLLEIANLRKQLGEFREHIDPAPNRLQDREATLACIRRLESILYAIEQLDPIEKMNKLPEYYPQFLAAKFSSENVEYFRKNGLLNPDLSFNREAIQKIAQGQQIRKPILASGGRLLGTAVFGLAFILSGIISGKRLWKGQTSASDFITVGYGLAAAAFAGFKLLPKKPSSRETVSKAVETRNDTEFQNIIGRMGGTDAAAGTVMELYDILQTPERHKKMKESVKKRTITPEDLRTQVNDPATSKLYAALTAESVTSEDRCKFLGKLLELDIAKIENASAILPTLMQAPTASSSTPSRTPPAHR